MRKIYFIFLAALLFSAVKTSAQCTGGTLGSAITPTTVWQSQSTVGGRYYTFNATAGNIYYFSYCSADGGNTTYDTQITILNNTGGYANGYNDDFCGAQSYLTWTAPASATYRCLVNKWNCTNQNNMGTMVYKFSGPLTCPNSLGAGTVSDASLPYSSGSGTTCGNGNNINSTNASAYCGASYYYNGEDKTWIFSPATTGTITINLTSTGSYTGLMLYQGCPFSVGSTCIAFAQDFSGSKSICVSVTAGVTYYLILDSWPSPTCNPFSNLTISAPGGALAGSTCANAPTITLPYSATGHSTACYGNNYNNSSTGSCMSLYESGEDRVYKYEATGAQCIGITLSNQSTSYTGFQVYNGCPGTAGTTCVGSFGGSIPLTGTVTLPGAGTYYIIVDTWASPSSASYSISIQSYGSGPTNDLPCNATNIPLGSTLTDDNNCSGGGGEPATPSCWWAGNLNTIWYSVVCPASGQLRIKTQAGTLTNTQIAVYSGSCGSLTMVTGGCNDDASSCGGYVYYSELLLSTLTPGATYFIRVDGYGNAVGTFTITATDGNISPPQGNQDCGGAIAVCGTIINEPAGFLGCGGVQDVPTSGSIPGNPSTNVNSANSGCMLSGELNTVWYHITIGSNGSLNWTLSPNTNGFWDWNLYPLNPLYTCSDISNNLVAPVRCNWNGSSTSSTGMQQPIPVGASASNFEAPLNVTAGQSYMLVMSNFSGTTAGYTLDFSGSTAAFATPSSITWTGSSSSSWTTSSNWGGCSTPSCSVNCSVPVGTNQPVISTNTTVKDITIMPGATLTINPGITLTVCGNFVNNGTLAISPTSTILFNNGTVNQTISGNLTGTNSLGNFTVTKAGGTVTFLSDIDIAGNFTTSTNTSVVNANSRYISVKGNFTNAAAGTTFTNVGSGTLSFNGATAQTYSPGGALTLNNVIMQHTGTGVTLSGNHMILGTSGNLTLTQGKIITGANEVRVNNIASASVTQGNTTSYVEGNLRRWINVTGSYDFPVGHATKGYQRANINFTLATTINNLLASFAPYGTVPAALNSSECGVTYNSPALDNGRWTINAYNSSLTQITGTGNYTATLYNLNYTNAIGAGGWTVMKDPGTGWGLNGTCSPSPVTAVVRTGMGGFSNFGTAQASSPLPITLISFEGKNSGKMNKLYWITASEQNNDFFTVEHSSDGENFEDIVRVKGAGNSSNTKKYEAIDENPFNGITYYRLKQTDFNSDFTYSQIIALHNHFDEINVFNVRPNPTQNELYFDFNTPVEGKITTEITDNMGRKIYYAEPEVRKGKNSILIPMNSFEPGIYSLKVTFPESDYIKILKIVKN
ncbi:MAG: hypothetical protein H0V01_09935 [Bacteroidetes bacterium]|nr:hypothetical protein [Bacteroidota bacterium]HET6246019.1 T9SS type A sorting domain-containing protein [Bacteroidia bacterium]